MINRVFCLKRGEKVKTILLSGVHGVGKGYFIEKVRNEINGYSIYSASSIISQYKCAMDAGYKKVSDVNRNQDILINALVEVQKREERNILLDGHICVYNSDGIVERIPEYFFSQANINGILLLQDSAEEVVKRIAQRDSRVICVDNIEKMQTEEERYARELAERYKIRYRIITHDCSRDEFEKILNELGGNL